MDYGVGSLVWVRQSNERWWPGQILNPNDLSISISHLTSPTIGTPVKLFDREDPYPAVEWYNLENSEQVKAFRCGEFDWDIAKAESSEGMPLKKRLRWHYPCGEKAIRHAIELEKQLQMMNQLSELDIASES